MGTEKRQAAEQRHRVSEIRTDFNQAGGEFYFLYMHMKEMSEMHLNLPWFDSNLECVQLYFSV